MQKRTRLLWVLLLSAALLFAQDVKLHIHALGHDHPQLHGHAAAEAVAPAYLSGPHLSTDASHDEHHAEIVSELEINPYSLLKKVSSSALTLALLATLFAMLLPLFRRPVPCRRRDRRVALSERYHLSPPLRAPPR